jgi:hypothetical protein
MKYSKALIDFEEIVSDYIKPDPISWLVVTGAAEELVHDVLSPHKKCECWRCMGGKIANA